MQEKTPSGDTPEPPKKKRRLRKILLITLAVLLVVRIIMPFVILHVLNKKLANLDGYYGHIDDVNLALIRGAYVIRDVYIVNVDSATKDTTPFFDCPRIDLSVHWNAIFEGKLVGEVEFEKPVVKYTMHKTVGKDAKDDTTNFIQLVRDFMPLKINRFAVSEGAIHYVDEKSSPKLDMPMTNVTIEGLNLTNEPDTGVALPATITMSGALYDGRLNVNVKLDPLNDVPTFDLNAEMSQTNLVSLNPFFTAYANFDVKKGTMSMYTEFAAKDGKFAGYVKPLLKDLDVVQFNKEEGGPAQIAWEALVGTVAEIFQNQRKEQLGTKVPVEGRFTKPDIKIVPAIVAVLQNAFVEALKPAIDNSISLQSVDAEIKQEEKKGFLDRVFDRDKKNDREKKKKRRGDK